MILSSIELLYLAAYLILVYEYVVMRHKVICAESDDVIYRGFLIDAYQREATQESMNLHQNRGMK